MLGNFWVSFPISGNFLAPACSGLLWWCQRLTSLAGTCLRISYHRTCHGCYRSQQGLLAGHQRSGTAPSKLSGIISGLPECSVCLLRRLPLVVDECHSIGLYCWFQIGNAGFKPVQILPFTSADSVHSRVVDGVKDVIPTLLNAAGRAVFDHRAMEFVMRSDRSWLLF